MIVIQNELECEHVNCAIGILIAENVRCASVDRLKAVKRELELELRAKYAQTERSALKTLHPMDAYIAYYKKFGYTYHVLPQLESVAKGKAIPGALAPVEAMFMAELKNMILTAGHDLDKIRTPLKSSVAAGEEIYTAFGGNDVSAIPGDIMIADQASVISSILRGPDQRTAITEQTDRVLYTVYAPPGVDEALIYRHLCDIENYNRIASETSVVCLKQVFT